jgi:hypothetical protein
VGLVIAWVTGAIAYYRTNNDPSLLGKLIALELVLSAAFLALGLLLGA